MMSATAILVFALGAAAEVPHWVQEKPLSSFKVPSIASIMPMLSMHGQQTSNSRRLQAIMSAECKAACPGAEAFITAMTPKRRLDAHGQMTMYCDHIVALKCTSTTKACQDKDPTETDKQGMAMVECMCACPKLATMGEDPNVICKDFAGTIGCAQSAPACAAMAKEQFPQSEKEIGLSCEYMSKGCQAKMDAMPTCAGDDMTVFATKCQGDDNMKANAAACCPIVKKLLGECIGIDCNTITMAVDKMKADKGDAEGKKSVASSENARQACPDAGVPSEAAVAATASEGKVSDGSGSSTDFAATGQTVSMLAMAAVIAGSLMA